MPPSTPDVRESSPISHPRRYLHTQMARQTPQNHRYIDVARGTLVRASLSPMRVLSLLSLLVKSALDQDLDQDLDLPFQSPCRIKSTKKNNYEAQKKTAKDTPSKTNILNPENIGVLKMISKEWFSGSISVRFRWMFSKYFLLCLASAGTSATSAIATLGLTISCSLNRWGKMHPDHIRFFLLDIRNKFPHRFRKFPSCHMRFFCSHELLVTAMHSFPEIDWSH